ncbi:MAG TPA: hypothetical protein VFQ39_13355, partial [Longimicrobium sp.]|nr:hypothetical protein [Longimicrobium sp.]
MARITLDIFSGRPNPTWEVDDQTAEQVLRDAANQRELVSDSDEEGRLGFRGLLVDAEGHRALSHHGLPGRFRLSGEDPRGAELALRLLERLGKPIEASDLPPGLARLEDLDLRRLIEDDVKSHGRAPETRSSSSDTSSASADAAAAQSVIQALSPAPVIGTDASSYSTIAQGSCSIEVATFNPNFWNTGNVRPYNNCYNYASNRRTDTFAQPGRAAGAQATVMQCSNVTTGAVADGALQSSTCASGPPRWYMALVIWPNVDYHWYRKSAEGFWGHKPGQTAARNYDNSGVVITNPQTANRGG